MSIRKLTVALGLMAGIVAAASVHGEEKEGSSVSTAWVDNGVYAGMRPDANKSWLLDGAIYEVNPAYMPNHSFGDLAAMMPRLMALHVKAVYLTPVFKSGGHGQYLIYDYYSIDPYFGGPDGLKALVREAHEHGIRVLLDLSTSLTPEGSDIYENHREWILRGDDGAMQRFFPFPDWGWAIDCAHPGFIEYVAKLVRYYAKEYDTDGWRIDSPCNNYDPKKVTSDHSRTKLLRTAKAAMEEVKPGVVFIAEVPGPTFLWSDISPQALPLFDEMCEVSYNYPLCGFMGGSEDGDYNYSLLRPFTAPDFMLAFEETLLNRVVHGKATSEEFVQGVLSQKVLYGSYRANFLENHDTARVSKAFPKQHRALFTLIATMPGVPVIHAGQEVGSGSPTGHAGGPGSPEIDWAHGDKELEAFYRRLMALRAENDAIRYGAFLALRQSGDPVLAYARRHGVNTVVVALNFRGEPSEATLQIPDADLGNASGVLKDLLGDKCISSEQGAFKVRLEGYGYGLYLLEKGD